MQHATLRLHGPHGRGIVAPVGWEHPHLCAHPTHLSGALHRGPGSLLPGLPGPLHLIYHIRTLMGLQASVAQLVEHFTCNEEIKGSNPFGGSMGV